MARKGHYDDKFSKAAHIKRHTQGTSNEISFSVLDAVKMELDGDKAAPARKPGHIPVFTLPGRRAKKVSTTPTKEQGLPLSTGGFAAADPASPPPSGAALPAALPDAPAPQAEPRTKQVAAPVSPELEIARRKARRKARKLFAVAFVAVASVALVSAGGYLLFQEYQSHQSHVSRLQSALDEVARVDEVIVSMDEVIASPALTESLEAMPGIEDRLPEARSMLDEADALTNETLDGMQESSDKEAAGMTVKAIDARRSMLASGEQIMEAAQQAAAASSSMAEAWEKVMEGDSLAREAAQLVVATTPENVAASKEKTLAAQTAFEAAQQQFGAIAAAYPKVDVSLHESYLAKRIEALGHAVASDDAILAEDTELAAAENDAYNAADAEAAKMAEGLPDDPTEPVQDVYQATVEEPAAAYEKARSEAAAADAFLRNYLGTAT